MLVASPLFAGSHCFGISLTELLATNLVPVGKALAGLEMFQQSDDVISSPEQAFDVMASVDKITSSYVVNRPS